MPETVEIPRVKMPTRKELSDARRHPYLPISVALSEWQWVMHRHEENLDALAKRARTWEEGLALFERYASQAVADGTLFKTLPEKYRRPGAVDTYPTYDGLRRKFVPLLRGKPYTYDAPRESGVEWWTLFRQANAEKQKIIQDVINGTGRPNPSRMENVRALIQRAKTALYNEYHTTTTLGSGNQAIKPPSGERNAEYERYKRLLDGFDMDIDGALAGEGVVGYGSEIDDEGNVSRGAAERGANAGYVPSLRALEKGGFLVGNRGLTKSAAKSMLVQAMKSMALGGMAYVENMRQHAAILSQEGFRRSGISYAGIGSEEIARIAGMVAKAADEIFAEHGKSNVSGTAFWTGNAKMSSNDRRFVDSLAEGGLSVEDLTRPVSKGDGAKDRHLDPVKLGQAMKSAGDMFYAKRNAGIGKFGKYMNLAVGSDASDLRYWRDLDPAVFSGNAQLAREFESLSAETDWYENVYNSVKALVLDLDASSKEDAAKARAAYFLSNPPPSWENPIDIQKWEQLAGEVPFIETVRDAVRSANRITGMGGADAPPPSAPQAGDETNMFADGTLGYDLVGGSAWQ